MNSTPPTEAERPLLAASPVPAALSEAVDLARAAAEEDAGDQQVGEYVGLALEDEASVTHLFDADTPGYRGWRWAVTVAWGGPDTEVTVSEVVLLPGPDALVAPDWVPWQERVQAGDLGVGDLMPTAPDDPRLVPAYLASDDEDVEETAMELGLGRVRVMARAARMDAAQRWKIGEFGPRSDMARGAPGHCGTCGFYLPVAGSLRAAFGVCGNEIAPADGHLVHAEYGCGAHSEAEVEQVSPVLVADLIYDDNALLDIEVIERPEPAAPPLEAEAPPEVPAQADDERAEVQEPSAELAEPRQRETELAEVRQEAPAHSGEALAEPQQVAESAEFPQISDQQGEPRQETAGQAEARRQDDEPLLRSDGRAEPQQEIGLAEARPDVSVQSGDAPSAEAWQPSGEASEARQEAESRSPSSEPAGSQPAGVSHEAEPLRQNDVPAEAQAPVEPVGAGRQEAEPQRPVDGLAEPRHQEAEPEQPADVPVVDEPAGTRPPEVEAQQASEGVAAEARHEDEPLRQSDEPVGPQRTVDAPAEVRLPEGEAQHQTVEPVGSQRTVDAPAEVRLPEVEVRRQTAEPGGSQPAAEVRRQGGGSRQEDEPAGPAAEG